MRGGWNDERERVEGWKIGYFKIKKSKFFSIVKNPISWIRVVMLAVYTMPISMNITYNQC